MKPIEEKTGVEYSGDSGEGECVRTIDLREHSPDFAIKQFYWSIKEKSNQLSPQDTGGEPSQSTKQGKLIIVVIIIFFFGMMRAMTKMILTTTIQGRCVQYVYSMMHKCIKVKMGDKPKNEN